MEDCDTLLMVGTNFPYTKHLPEPGQARVVQIEADPVRAGHPPPDRGAGGRRRQRRRCGAAAPARAATTDRGFLEKYQKAMNDWRRDMEALEDAEARPDRPAVPRARCSTSWPPTTRSSPATRGTIATWAARHSTIRGDRQFYLSGNLATMAPGLPYAIGIAARVPGPAGDRVRRRRRLRHAHGRVPHRRPLRAADQGGDQQQQRARPDPVGADGARLSRARRPVQRAAADFAAWARACGAFGVKVREPDDVRRRDQRRAGLRRPGAGRRRASTRTSRRCPGKVDLRTGQEVRRGVPARASRARRPSPRRSFKDKIQQLKAH